MFSFVVYNQNTQDKQDQKDQINLPSSRLKSNELLSTDVLIVMVDWPQPASTPKSRLRSSNRGIWAAFDPLPLVTLIKYIDFRVFRVSGVSWGNLNRIHIWGTKWEFHRGTHVNL